MGLVRYKTWDQDTYECPAHMQDIASTIQVGMETGNDHVDVFNIRGYEGRWQGDHIHGNTYHLEPPSVTNYMTTPVCNICSRESTYNLAEVHRARPVSDISVRVVPVPSEKVREVVHTGSASAYSTGGARIQVPEMTSATRVHVPDYQVACTNPACLRGQVHVQQEVPVCRHHHVQQELPLCNHMHVQRDMPVSVVPLRNKTVKTPKVVPLSSSYSLGIKDYLVWNILASIFCCLCFGAVGIMRSMDVRDASKKGDVDDAMKSSRHARRWACAAFGIGMVLYITALILIIVFIAGNVPFPLRWS